MGGEKQTTSGTTTNVTNQTTTQTPTPTAEETALNKLMLERQQAAQPYMLEADRAGLTLINQLLTGTTPLPGFFGEMAQGISPSTIGETASRYGRRALPQMQSLGLTDSGPAARSIAQGIASDLLYPVEQFNIGVKQNLLNQALTGTSQVQAPVMAGANTLAGSLAGLRSITSTGTGSTTGTSTSTVMGMNPFLKSFETSLGKTLGSPKFGFGGGYGSGMGFGQSYWTS